MQFQCLVIAITMLLLAMKLNCINTYQLQSHLHNFPECSSDNHLSATTEEFSFERTNEKKLSRKRRYLIFPEGSSFQLVYDEIIGVVDYTNYLILGITVALAWELPTKPPSEMLEDLRDRLRDGTLGISRIDEAQSNNTTLLSDAARKSYQRKVSLSQPNYISFQNGPSILGKSSASNYYHNNANWKQTFQPPMNGKYYTNYAPYAIHGPRYYNTRVKDNYNGSLRNNPLVKWLPTKTTNTVPSHIRRVSYTGKTTNTSQYPWWHLASKISSSSRNFNNENSNKNSRHQSAQQQLPASGYYQSAKKNSAGSSGARAMPAKRNHRIFPVYGKRSIAYKSKRTKRNLQNEKISNWHYNTTAGNRQVQFDAEQEVLQQRGRHRRSGIERQRLSKLDRIHIRYHRSTRQTLYDRIERYLDKRGAHGHHCVLRALCETGQKLAEEDEPGSFVAELMRVIFTLPEAIEDHEYDDGNNERDHTLLTSLQQRYDAANSYRGNCEKRYLHCKDSLWSSHFVM